jgi:hypothetical protein
MYPALLLVPAVFLLSCPAFSAAASGDCFTQQGESYTKSANNVQRISEGIACPESSDQVCQLIAVGVVDVQNTLNDTKGDDATELTGYIRQDGKIDFPVAKWGTVPGEMYDVRPGRAGYYGFTPTYRCYVGVLGNCLRNFTAGTWVEACRVVPLGQDLYSGIPDVQGTTSFIDTDRDTIANMTTNPAMGPGRPSLGRIQQDRRSDGVTLGHGGEWVMATVAVIGIGGWLAF